MGSICSYGLSSVNKKVSLIIKGKGGILMTVEQNKAIVNRIWQEIFNEGKLHLIDDLYDANYVYHGPGCQELKGTEGLKKYKAELRTIFPDVHFSLEIVIAEGDKVASHWTMRATYKPNNKQVTLKGIIISRIVDGKCVEDWEIFDRLSAAEQGATGIGKKMVNVIVKTQNKKLPFLSLST
jgi:predicted SnoaL-like aldol condensation-catalyzing enzyme